MMTGWRFSVQSAISSHGPTLASLVWVELECPANLLRAIISSVAQGGRPAGLCYIIESVGTMIMTISLNQRLQTLSESKSACLKHYKIYAGAKVGERRRNKHQCTKQRPPREGTVVLYRTCRRSPPCHRPAEPTSQASLISNQCKGLPAHTTPALAPTPAPAPAVFLSRTTEQSGSAGTVWQGLGTVGLRSSLLFFFRHALDDKRTALTHPRSRPGHCRGHSHHSYPNTVGFLVLSR